MAIGPWDWDLLVSNLQIWTSQWKTVGHHGTPHTQNSTKFLAISCHFMATWSGASLASSPQRFNLSAGTTPKLLGCHIHLPAQNLNAEFKKVSVIFTYFLSLVYLWLRKAANDRSTQGTIRHLCLLWRLKGIGCKARHPFSSSGPDATFLVGDAHPAWLAWHSACFSFSSHKRIEMNILRKTF